MPRAQRPDLTATAENRSCAQSDGHDAWNAIARGESPLKRVDRAYTEILQELRVAQTGVQILLAFLFTLAFTSRFATITSFQRDVYVATLLLGSGAIALLIAPAAFHRMIYRRRLKGHLVRAAHRLALAGLLLLLATMGSALLLILDIVIGMHPAMLLTGVALGWFVTWWFVLPTWTRVRHRACAAAAGPASTRSTGSPAEPTPGEAADEPAELPAPLIPAGQAAL
jgi:hypothetical protein